MRVTHHWIPTGTAGTTATVRRIVGLIKRGAVDPLVRQYAAKMASAVSPRDRTAQLREVRAWMGAYFRFLRDPYGDELLHSADTLLRQYGAQGYIQADCDDAAILAGALARSIGFKVRLKTVSFRKTGGFQHIWAEVYSPDEHRWVEMDVTRTSQDLDSRIVRQFVTLV